MQSILIIGGIIVGYFVTMFVTKKFAQKVYNETGYNAVDGLNRFLMGCIYALPIIVSIGSDVLSGYQGGTNNTSLLVILLLIPLVILLIRNFKAKNPVNIILLTVLQALGGLFIVLVGIIKIALSLIGLRGKGGSALGLNIDTTQREVADLQNLQVQQIAQQDRDDEDRKQDDIERADAYAQKQGFKDADEAESFGIRTGKPRE